MTSAERIYAAVAKIPAGKVATYTDIARMAFVPNPRLVGTALHKNKNWKAIPCHRVVNMAGRLAPSFGMGGARIQEIRLGREGVTFKRKTKGHVPGIVCLAEHRWKR
jgi:methylated-DNA-protein-cysteine methyltransferase related protein